MADPAEVFALRGARVYVAGHRGMVGSAVARRLAAEGCEVVTADRAIADLRRQDQVEAFMARAKPDAVVVAAAKVGGILANDTLPAEFLYDNLMIEANLIEAAHRNGVNRLLFLGSSCIYPREAPNPITEDALLTGPLEKTNEWYAIAKIAGIKLCQAYRRQYGRDYISAMPCNLYGPGDYFHPERSHVIPALLQRFHEAAREGRESVTCWGSGTPRREFMHVDDVADACAFLLRHYSGESHLNIGTGTDITIRELAEQIARVTGFKGRIDWDTSKPDGTMLKRMDVSRIAALGWRARIGFAEGLEATYRWFLDQPALRT
ncbi:GDP-L-fucose synthase [Roseomonas alkaliterrae]|uniref:GDP-L-fucose synthase n=1 Tax=Neoroseomonas alkaliterrae TaxID=1452450 RepID=A0A840Y3X7_9PROT|nr:GDP-L-fucose synthase [Neoroseomonas alkaliterrae]MBB5688883.1 GDP-L-fucose synthase [Neoroseomonas alkaliterrae]